MKLVSTNPSDNYSVLGEVEVSTQQDVDRAVEKARKAQADWAGLPLEERIAALQSFVEISKQRSDDIKRAMAIETGRPYAALNGHMTEGFAYWESYFAQASDCLVPRETKRSDTEVHTVYKEPWGVIAAICPWNYPYMNVAWQCGQALIAGNTIVYKNSEENPLFAVLLAELFAQSDVPDGVFNVLQGDGSVGRMMVEADVDMVSFTGSSKTGREIAKIAADRFIPFIAELGGSSPAIVFEDIPVDDQLIGSIYGSRFLHSGQICASIKRLIVHESKYQDVVSKLVALIESKKVGGAFEDNVDLGPLVAERQAVRIADQVDDAISKGATVSVGGKRPDDLKGAFYLPTVLTDVSRDMKVWNEETFGPVLPVVPFSTEAEAVELANDTEYGLSAFVMTNDGEKFSRVARKIQSGSVVQNFGEYCYPTSPFGGYKKSGMGRTGGDFGFDDVTQTKLVSTAI